MKYINMYNSYGCHYIVSVKESYDCIKGVCKKAVGESGRYNSLEECKAVCNCTTYDCTKDASGNKTCGKATGHEGVYNTMAECEKVCDCETFDCINGTCSKAVGCDGMYNSMAECKAVCNYETFDCIKDASGNKTCSKATGHEGMYNSMAECQKVCDCVTYDCTKDASGVKTCSKADGCDGAYNTMAECEAVCDCETYDCSTNDAGVKTCSKADGCDGVYNTMAECNKVCNPCQECGWISIYDSRLQQSVAGDKYCDNDCGHGFTQYYSDTGNYYDSGGGPFPAKCIDGCLSITKANVLAHDYVAFIQYFSPTAYPVDAPCSSYCVDGATVTSQDPVSSDKKWYIQFQEAGSMKFEIHNQQQDPITDKCYYQLAIYKGCSDTPVEGSPFSLPLTQLTTTPIYTGVADVPYRIYLEFATPPLETTIVDECDH